MSKVFKIEFYVPIDYAEKVKQAVFDTGAGKIGNYDCCAWQTVGTGQFRPLPGSKPFTGSHNKIDYLQEVKVEMVCQEQFIDQAINALHKSHPYETPAVQWWPVDC